MARHPSRCSGFSRAVSALFAVAAATHAAAQAPPLALADSPHGAPARPVPLLVFAAASLADVIDEIGGAFTAQTGTEVRASYAASSVLAKQIEAGAPADVFLAADVEWMDYLEKRGLLKRGSRHDLLGNTLVLVAAADSTLQLKIEPGFDLAGALGRGRLAVGDPDSVPAGMYAQAALVKLEVWDRVKDQLAGTAETLTMGDVAADLSLFMGAVIDSRAFGRHVDALARAQERPAVSVLTGGRTDGSNGYFVQPTVLTCSDPTDELFSREYFGPILGVHVYPDADFDAMVAQAADVAPYALTGAIVATDRAAIARATDALRYSAGNFYINDKPTGAVVGQQPFGGARASGTNDKAGSIFNLIRWVNARAIKETFVPPADHRYPHMG